MREPPRKVAGQLIIDGYNGTDIRRGETVHNMGRFIGGGGPVDLYHNNNLRISTTGMMVQILVEQVLSEFPTEQQVKETHP